MSEKRFKVRIKNGNVEIETISGFSDGQCHSTVEAIVNGAGLSEAESQDREMPAGDPTAFVAGNY